MHISSPCLSPFLSSHSPSVTLCVRRLRANRRPVKCRPAEQRQKKKRREEKPQPAEERRYDTRAEKRTAQRTRSMWSCTVCTFLNEEAHLACNSPSLAGLPDTGLPSPRETISPVIVHASLLLASCCSLSE